MDDAAGVELALGRLSRARREQIAFLAGPERFGSSRVRLGAFVRAETARGTFVPERILEAESFAEASYERVARALDEKLSFDALVCFNIMAAGALRVLYDAGVTVPGEVAVVGHDDIPMAAWLEPPLSTLRVSKRDLGVGARCGCFYSVSAAWCGLGRWSFNPNASCGGAPAPCWVRWSPPQQPCSLALPRQSDRAARRSSLWNAR